MANEANKIQILCLNKCSLVFWDKELIQRLEHSGDHIQSGAKNIYYKYFQKCRNLEKNNNRRKIHDKLIGIDQFSVMYIFGSPEIIPKFTSDEFQWHLAIRPLFFSGVIKILPPLASLRSRLFQGYANPSGLTQFPPQCSSMSTRPPRLSR